MHLILSECPSLCVASTPLGSTKKLVLGVTATCVAAGIFALHEPVSGVMGIVEVSGGTILFAGGGYTSAVAAYEAWTRRGRGTIKYEEVGKETKN